MNKTKLREFITMYLDDIESYGTETELNEATDVLFDFFKYVEALDFEGETIETVELQDELIQLLEGQITDLTLMSKIELIEYSNWVTNWCIQNKYRKTSDGAKPYGLGNDITDDELYNKWVESKPKIELRMKDSEIENYEYLDLSKLDLTDELLEKLKHNGSRLASVEGTPESGWMLIDFGSVIVHIFSPAQRSYYRLEELWQKAPIVVRIL